MSKQKPNNPFLISGYLSPEYFCDREVETKLMADALANGRNLTLISPRRYGKTGLIHHLFHALNQDKPKLRTIYMDIFSTRTLDDFVTVFAESVIRELSSNTEKAIRNFGHLFKNLRPVVSYDALTGQPQLSVTLDKNSDTESSLHEVFNYLKQLPDRCYIAIDEFQQINNYPEKGTEALLRSYIQFLPNVSFIFSGSILHTMQDMFLSPKRPFYQSTQMLQLHAIEKESYFSFAEKHFKKEKLKLNKSSFDTIYNQFDGHTWYVQAVLNRLYAFRKDVTDETLIFEAINQLMEENSFYYQELLRAYSHVQVKLIEAIAQEKQVSQINAGEFISKYTLKNASSVNRALSKLVDNEVVYKSEQYYMIYDRLMGLWLSRLKG